MAANLERSREKLANVLRVLEIERATWQQVCQQLGTQTMTDLLLAIQTQSSAQSAYSQARHRLVVSELLLKQSAGQIGEADLQQVDALLR